MSDVEIINARQNVAPRLDSAVKDIERLLVVVIGTGEVMGYSRGVDAEGLGAGAGAGAEKTGVSLDGGDIANEGDREEEVEGGSSRDTTSSSSSSEGGDGREVSDLSKIDLMQELWSKYKSKGAPVSVSDSEDVRQGQGQAPGISDSPKSGPSKSSYKKSMKAKRNMADDYDS